MKKTAVILGAGMVGAAMARDLAGSDDIDVTVVDANAAALDRLRDRLQDRVTVKRADLGSAAAVVEVVTGKDVVMGALSSRLGLQTLAAVSSVPGARYVDISFMADDALALDAQAKARGACCVVDCGVAPGMSNLLAGHAVEVLARCDRIDIFVGGLPAVRSWPWEYKAGFAPSDVIEEYVRPARFVIDGEVVVKEALSEPELLDFEGVGTLEAFNTDGLRSLITTLPVKDMSEKTLRYPGHIALMKALRHAGFFREDLVDVKGQKVRPLDVTSALLFPQWSFDEGEADITVLRVSARGVDKTGGAATLTWDMHDRFDPASGLRSMSRTTAFPATAVARALLDGTYDKPGVVAPEALAKVPGLAARIVDELAQRNVLFTFSPV